MLRSGIGWRKYKLQRIPRPLEIIPKLAVNFPKLLFRIMVATMKNPAEGPIQLKKLAMGIVASPQFSAAKYAARCASLVAEA